MLKVIEMGSTVEQRLGRDAGEPSECRLRAAEGFPKLYKPGADFFRRAWAVVDHRGRIMPPFA